jgi:peptidoglycan hydrolase-like amidase
MFACRTAPPPLEPIPATPRATPTPEATAPAATVVPTPSAGQSSPQTVRILVTAPTQAFPEPGRRYTVSGDGATRQVRGPIEISSDGRRPALQVGAFREAGHAEDVAERLRAGGVETLSRSGGGLVRVMALGGTGEDENALRARIAALGIIDAIRVADPAPARVTLRCEGREELRAGQFDVVPLDPEPVRVGGKRLRGRFIVRPGRSGVSLINVLELESYLRAVVPAEMGPRTFGAIEALKAQAVAARTYAVAHLGDHEDEGYDLCDSQACQVYGGVDVEHPLSDAAVVETAGEVVTHAGRPIDAMYHSTCAGHTEDAAAVFPERAAPYLKGVPCRGEARVELSKGAPSGPWVDGIERLALVAEEFARVLGVQPEAAALATRLGGGSPGKGLSGLARAYRLEGVAPLIRRDSLTDAGVMELLRIFQMPLPEAGDGTPRRRWELAGALRLAQLDGAVVNAGGRVVAGENAPLLVGDRTGYTFIGSAATLERRGERVRRGPVRAATGSPASGWFLGERLVAVEVEPLDEADARSAWVWWVREIPLAEIGRKLNVDGVRSFEVTRRGVSGRALSVKVVGARASSEMDAYRFRRTLDLPDTLFSVAIRSTPSGAAARFLGRGWGHGVGMCQNGAYGLALGGATYREILAAYYTGVEVTRWSFDRGGAR